MTDEEHLARCLELAERGKFTVAPNPMVGCVIVHQNAVVAEGYHQKFGGAHAEVEAYDNLAEDIPIVECTVYVNLEPCSFYGKTPPCASMLVSKRPKRVVVGTLDPHKKVAGRGVKMLLEAGIEVKVGILETECQELNEIFFKAHKIGKPFITLKWAETKNGYMARKKGDTSTAKISSPNSDTLVHKLRASHQAILVGAGTANRDNPLLNVRLSEGHSPIKIILSPSNSVKAGLQLFNEGKTLVYISKENADKNDNLDCVPLEDFSLETVMTDLFQRGIHSILVEGGPTILQAFLTQKLWDKAIVIKSQKDWSEGVEAPWIGIPSVREIKSATDTIKYFKP